MCRLNHKSTIMCNIITSIGTNKKHSSVKTQSTPCPSLCIKLSLQSYINLYELQSDNNYSLVTIITHRAVNLTYKPTRVQGTLPQHNFNEGNVMSHWVCRVNKKEDPGRSLRDTTPCKSLTVPNYRHIMNRMYLYSLRSSCNGSDN